MCLCRSTMTRQSHRIIILNLKKKNKYLISMFAKIYYNIKIWSDLYNKFLKNKLNHPHFLFTRIYCNKTLLSNSRIQNIFNITYNKIKSQHSIHVQSKASISNSKKTLLQLVVGRLKHFTLIVKEKKNTYLTNQGVVE